MWAVDNCYPAHSFALNQFQHVSHKPSKQHHLQLHRAHACLYQHRHAGITFHGPRSPFWRTPAHVGRNTNNSITTDSAITNATPIGHGAKNSASYTMPTPTQLMQQTITQDSNFSGNHAKERVQVATYHQCCGAAWMWKTCRAKIYAKNTAEAELIACSLAAEYAIYGRKALHELRVTLDPSACFGDNQAATTICNRNHTSRKERHMRVRADHIKGVVEDELVTFHDISSDTNCSDIGTKPIVNKDMWRYLGAILHGKIRLGIPRSDFTSLELRVLMETSDFHHLRWRIRKSMAVDEMTNKVGGRKAPLAPTV